MTGFELRIWRKTLGWSRERAAEELGVSLRTWKEYENAAQVRRAIELATRALSTANLLETMHKKKDREALFAVLQRMHQVSPSSPDGKAGN